MSCLCGDIACPSCGPAQGFDPGHEAMCESIASALPEGLVDVLEEAGWEDEDGDAYEHIVELVVRARQDALDGIKAQLDSWTQRRVAGIVPVEIPAAAERWSGVEACRRIWEFVEGAPHPSRTEEEIREMGW